MQSQYRMRMNGEGEGLLTNRREFVGFKEGRGLRSTG